MLTEKDYCDYDTCVALKELGYKVPTSAYYMPKNSQLIFVSNPCRGGYVIDCFYSHNSLPKDVMTANYIDAPTMWEAQKWLREEKEVYVTVIPEYDEFGPVKGVKYRLEVAYWKDDKFGYGTIEWLDDECPHTIITFDSYEEAFSEGIKEAVKIRRKMKMNKEYKALEVLSARLAESVLMDWDKEEQVRLAKEIATKCHLIFNDKESREFVSLVKRMREAQNRMDMLTGEEDIDFIDMVHIEAREAETEVDEYLKKIEI